MTHRYDEKVQEDTDDFYVNTLARVLGSRRSKSTNPIRSLLRARVKSTIRYRDFTSPSYFTRTM